MLLKMKSDLFRLNNKNVTVHQLLALTDCDLTFLCYIFYVWNANELLTKTFSLAACLLIQ